MNRPLISIFTRIAGAFLVAIMTLLGAATAWADTNVAGAINVDTSWTLAGSPYVLTSDVTIQTGITLTIEPGVRVVGTNASSSDVELIVSGTLVAEGTEGQPIVFEGQDTSAVGYWEGLLVQSTGDASLRHVRIANADVALEVASGGTTDLGDLEILNFRTYGIYYLSLSGAQTINGLTLRTTSASTSYGVRTTGATVSLSNCEIDGATYGVWLTNTGMTMSRCVIANSTRAVYAQSTAIGTYALSVSYSTFFNNTDVFYTTRNSSSSYGLTLSVTRSIFQDNTIVARSTNASYPTTFTNFTQNVHTGTALFTGMTPSNTTGTLNYDPLLVDPENGNYAPTSRSPARYFSPTDPATVAGAIAYAGDQTGPGLFGFYYEDEVFVRDQTYSVIGDMVIAPGTQLRFDLNSRFEMATTDRMAGGLDPARIEIRVEGRFVSDGTLTRPVTFTSGAASPSRGDWYGILVPSNAELSSVAQLDIGYARRGFSVYDRDVALADSRIHDCQLAGIYVEGGSPDFISFELYDNATALEATDDADVTFTDVVVRDSTSTRAVYLNNASLLWAGGLAYDNNDDVIYARSTTVGSRNVNLRGVTFADNGGDAIDASRNSSSSYALSVSLLNTNITDNTGAGLRNGNTSYPFSFTCTNSNVWGNGPNYASISTSSATCVSWNPLYADQDTRNYAPTRFSPLRGLGSGGGVIGGVPYGGAIGPQYMGFVWDDITFTAAGSPYNILGDLYVTSGAQVTFEPGTTFRVAPNADGMGGGTLTTRTEVRFLPGAEFVFPSSGEPIVFTPATTSPSPGNWQGFYFENNTGIVELLRAEYASTGYYVEGPKSPEFRYSESRFSSTGAQVSGVTDSVDRARFLGFTAIGSATTTGNGILSENSLTRIRSSFITHFSKGIRATSTVVGSFSLESINNTIVSQGTGIEFTRNSSSSYGLSGTVYNTLIEGSTTYAIRNTNSSYPATLSLGNNAYFGVNTVSISGSLGSNHVTGDPFIEDDDWNSRPRWWDPQVWRESPAINAGLASAPQLPATDLYGRPRTLSTRVDIGAVEHDFTANQEPRADAAAGSVVAPTGETFQYSGALATDPDGTIANAFWTFSDGAVTAGLTVNHTFAARGTREAYLTIVDDDGAEDHARVIVNVNDRPVAEANGPYAVDVGGELARFRSDNSFDPEGGALTYFWDLGNGQTSVLANPTSAYDTAGFYIATLTVTDTAGLSATDTAVVEVLGVDDTQGPLVQHVPPPNGQPAGVAVPIEVTAQDASGVQTILMFYRPVGSVLAEELSLSLIAGDRWGTTIPAGQVAGPGMEYWFVATDTVGSPSTRSPVGAGTYSFTVSGDLTPPVIVHTEIGNNQPAGNAVTVSATVTDSAGLSAVNLYYGSTAGGFAVLPMSNVTGNIWSAQIPAVIVNPPGVKYYIEALDASPSPNRAILPTTAPTAFFDFTVGSGDTSPPTIAVTPVPNDRPANAAVVVTANIADASGVVSGAALYYRTGGVGPYSSATMSNTSGSTWTATIPAPAVETPLVQYYVTATDGAGNTATQPDTAPGGPLQFTVVAADTTPPTITHTPVPNGQAIGVAVPVSATVTDASAITYVRLHYKRSTSSAAAPWPYVEMTNTGADIYTAEIPDFVLGPPSIVYYIRALDAAGNTALLPEGSTDAPFTFSVGTTDSTPPVISHTPITSVIGGGTITFTATITDDSAVNGASVFYAADDGAFTELALSAAGANIYSATLDTDTLPDGVERVRYYFRASDSAGNSVFSPASGIAAPNVIEVTYPDTTGPSLTLDTVAGPITAGVAQALTATASDPAGVVEVAFFYRTGTSGPYSSLVGSSTGGDGWTATVPAGAVAVPSLQYYASARDGLGNETTSVARLTTVETEPDLTPPTLTASTVPDGQPEGVAVTITATASDDSGIASVTLYYRRTGAATWSTRAMTPDGGSSWVSSIPAGSVTTDGVQYYVEAVDAAAAANVARAPDTAPATPRAFTVVTIDAAGPTLTHAAPALPIYAGDLVEVSVDAADPSGVDGVSLYWRRQGSSSAYTMVPMTETAGTWTADIGPVATPGFDYYFEAADALANVSLEPSGAPTTVRSRPVVTRDTSAPVITHSAIVGPVAPGSPQAVVASVTDNTGVAAVELSYRTGATGTYTTVAMLDGGGGSWSAVIPGAAVQVAGVQYYIRATDTFAEPNEAFAPSTAPSTPYNFAVGSASVDTTPPLMSHLPPTGPVEPGVALELVAAVSDASGVAGVRVFYRVEGDPSFSSTDMAEEGGLWRATIAGRNLDEPALEYYLVATDASSQANQAFSPAGAPTDVYSVNVERVDRSAPVILVSVLPDSIEAGTPLGINALVTDESGVSSVQIRIITGGTTISVPMTSSGGDAWTATIPGAFVSAPALEFYVEAVDSAPTGNSATSPADAPLSVLSVAVTPSEEVDRVGPTINGDIASPQPAGEALRVGFTITDANGVTSATLYARHADDAFTAIPLAPSAGQWRGEIPSETMRPGTVFWYVEAIDGFSNMATFPLGGDVTPSSFTVEGDVGQDIIPPTIAHTQDGGYPAGSTAVFSATVTDASGVDGVTLYYRYQGTTDFLATEAVQVDSDLNLWEATIDAAEVTVGTLQYYLGAVDASTLGNLAYLPSAAPTTFFSVTVYDDSVGDDVTDAGDVGDAGDAGFPTDAGADVGDAGLDAFDGASDVIDFDTASDAGGDTTAPDTVGDSGSDTNGAPDTQTDAGSLSDASVDGSDSLADTSDQGAASGNSSSGGCAASSSPSGSSALSLLALGALIVLRRRRRSDVHRTRER